MSPWCAPSDEPTDLGQTTAPRRLQDSPCARAVRKTTPHPSDAAEKAFDNPRCLRDRLYTNELEACPRREQHRYQDTRHRPRAVAGRRRVRARTAGWPPAASSPSAARRPVSGTDRVGRADAHAVGSAGLPRQARTDHPEQIGAADSDGPSHHAGRGAPPCRSRPGCSVRRPDRPPNPFAVRLPGWPRARRNDAANRARHQRRNPCPAR